MNKRNLIIAVLFGLVAVTVLVLLRGKPETPGERAETRDPNVVDLSLEAQQNVGLALAEVAEMPIQREVKATGIVSSDQSRVAHIFPLARGIVETVYVQLGDKVREGQPLVSYDNIELGQFIGEYLSLRGGLERLAAQQQVSKRFLDRAQALIEVEAISQREFELRQAEYDQAKAAVESQRAELARVEEQLHRFGMTDQDIQALGGSDHGPHRTASHNVLRAPLSGIVTQFDVSQGELIDRDRELFTLVDTSVVWVLADVYEKDIGLIPATGECRVTVPSYPGEVFRGTITYVSDFLDPSSRTAKVRCVVPNRDGRLKLEMFATVEIPAAQARTALSVPVAALQQVGTDTVVFVQLGATHFEKRVVQTGERGEEWVEVVSGPRRGEKVVTTGSFYLKSTLLRELIGAEE